MRAVFLNFAKSVVLLVMFGTAQVWHVVNANPLDELPWVIDEQQHLSIKITKGITHLLTESALNRNIHVRVLVLNVRGENLKELVNQKVMEMRNKLPFSWQAKTTFFVINLGTNKSTIILGDALVKTEPLYQSLNRIQHKIILPLMAEGEMDKAIAQGVVALTTVLEADDVATYASSVHKAYVWLSDHSLLLPCTALFLISLLFGMYKGYRYCFPLHNLKLIG